MLFIQNNACHRVVSIEPLAFSKRQCSDVSVVFALHEAPNLITRFHTDEFLPSVGFSLLIFSS